MSVLPTLLFFTTSVLKEIAGKTRGDAVNLYSHPVTVAALHTLRSLCTDKFCKDDVAGPQWKALLQSTLAKIIDLIKTSRLFNIYFIFLPLPPPQKKINTHLILGVVISCQVPLNINKVAPQSAKDYSL